jgi:hypothetical protein
VKIDQMLKEFTKEGNQKLDKQYTGTKQAIVEISREKVQKFMQMGDVGLDKNSRDVLTLIISGSMMQSFSLGYGIGKVEGVMDRQIFL